MAEKMEIKKCFRCVQATQSQVRNGYKHGHNSTEQKIDECERLNTYAANREGCFRRPRR